MSHDCSTCSGSGQTHHAPCVGEGCAACRLLGSAPCGACGGTGEAEIAPPALQDLASERDQALRGLARARGLLESLRQLLVAPQQSHSLPRAAQREQRLLKLVEEALDETTAEALGLAHVQIDLLAEPEDAHVD